MFICGEEGNSQHKVLSDAEAVCEACTYKHNGEGLLQLSLCCLFCPYT